MKIKISEEYIPSEDLNSKRKLLFDRINEYLNSTDPTTMGLTSFLVEAMKEDIKKNLKSGTNV